jgi:hypothetical protein
VSAVTYRKKQGGKFIGVCLNAELFAMVKENPRGIVRQASRELKENKETSSQQWRQLLLTLNSTPIPFIADADSPCKIRVFSRTSDARNGC